jgi:hypothetical protein
MLAIASFIAWLGSESRSRDETEKPETDVESIDRDLAPPAGSPASREGIAAIVLMDVSGSMRESVGEGAQAEPKIDIARRAAEALVGQFAAYGQAHPDEPVLVGLMEFSERPPSAAREVIPLSPPDPLHARAALARMTPEGGTPIGDAMVEGKRAHDRSGLTRRHLLVVTDGANTDGRDPEDVMRALAKRPEAERPSVYFVAFDVAASRFDSVRDAGGLVLAASNAQELDKTLGALLTGKILVEGP